MRARNPVTADRQRQLRRHQYSVPSHARCACSCRSSQGSLSDARRGRWQRPWSWRPPGATVVEYGVGTGSFTGAIKEQVKATECGRYLGIEREAGFVDILRQRFPTLSFVNDQVERIEQLLEDHDMRPPQAILSGLPLILLPTMNEIVERTEQVLAPGGEFRTFSYLQSYPTAAAGRLRRLMRDTFAEFSISPLVWRNFPPAFVLRGRKAG